MFTRFMALRPAARQQSDRSGASRDGHLSLRIVNGLWALVAVCGAVDAALAGTIEFGDAALELREGAGARLTVVRTGDISAPAAALLELDVVDHTATPNADFTLALPGGVVEFAAGEFFKLIEVAALADAELEGTEHQSVVLRSPLGASLGRQDRARLIINDAAVSDSYYLFANPNPIVTVREGETVELQLGRSLPAIGGTIDVTVAGGSARLGVDYADPSVRVLFAAGAGTVPVSIATIEDAVNEGTETIELLLSMPTPQGVVARDIRAVVLIEDDDGGQPGQFRVLSESGQGNQISARESAALTLRVTRDGGTTGVVSVDYATVDAWPTASGERDYAPTRGTLVFADGATEQRLSIPLVNDDNSTRKDDFRVVLANPTGGASLDPRASSVTVTVVDDDFPTNYPIVVGAPACFVATAAYGSYLDPHVVRLRAFRDHHLLTNRPGRAFVAWYYHISPPIAAVIGRHGALRAMTRWALTPVVLTISYPLWALGSILGIGVALARARSRARG